MNISFTLTRNDFSRLVLIDATGERYENVVPVRAFPIGAPEDGVALVDAEGHELAWIEKLSDLPETLGELVKEELARREFIPTIMRIISASSYACPSTWHVETDRGTSDLSLKGEEDIRRLGEFSLLIADTHGIHYLIRDISALDRLSRKILDRFL